MTPDQLTIQLDAPSAAGSVTSELAADSVQVDHECYRVLLYFASQSEPRTRHDCAAVVYAGTDHGVPSVCARVNALVFLKLLVEVGKKGKRSTLIVTTKGSEWLRRRASR